MATSSSIRSVRRESGMASTLRRADTEAKNEFLK